MPRVRSTRITSSEPPKEVYKSVDPKNRVEQLKAMTLDDIEERLRNGTATSQDRAMVLKLSQDFERDELERQLLEAQVALAQAKKEKIDAERRNEEMIEEAMRAFRIYSGDNQDDDFEEGDEF